MIRRGSPLENFIAANPKLAEKLYKNRPRPDAVERRQDETATRNQRPQRSYASPSPKSSAKKEADVPRAPVRASLVKGKASRTKAKMVSAPEPKKVPEPVAVDLEGASLAKKAFAIQSGIVPQASGVKGETQKPKPSVPASRVSLVRERARVSRLVREETKVVQESKNEETKDPVEKEAKEDEGIKEEEAKAVKEAKEDEGIKGEEAKVEEEANVVAEKAEEETKIDEPKKEENAVAATEEEPKEPVAEEAPKRDESANEAKPPSTPTLPSFAESEPEAPRILSRRERLTRAIANKPAGGSMRALAAPKRKECGCKRRR